MSFVEIRNWRLMPDPNFAAVTIHGINNRTNMMSQTTIVTERIARDCVRTMSGTKITLIGPPLALMIKIFNAEFYKAFLNGFPENWQQLINAELSRLLENSRKCQKPNNSSPESKTEPETAKPPKETTPPTINDKNTVDRSKLSSISLPNEEIDRIAAKARLEFEPKSKPKSANSRKKPKKRVRGPTLTETDEEEEKADSSVGCRTSLSAACYTASPMLAQRSEPVSPVQTVAISESCPVTEPPQIAIESQPVPDTPTSLPVQRTEPFHEHVSPEREDQTDLSEESIDSDEDWPPASASKRKRRGPSEWSKLKKTFSIRKSLSASNSNVEARKPNWLDSETSPSASNIDLIHDSQCESTVVQISCLQESADFESSKVILSADNGKDIEPACARQPEAIAETSKVTDCGAELSQEKQGQTNESALNVEMEVDGPSKGSKSAEVAAPAKKQTNVKTKSGRSKGGVVKNKPTLIPDFFPKPKVPSTFPKTPVQADKITLSSEVPTGTADLAINVDDDTSDSINNQPVVFEDELIEILEKDSGPVLVSTVNAEPILDETHRAQEKEQVVTQRSAETVSEEDPTSKFSDQIDPKSPQVLMSISSCSEDVPEKKSESVCLPKEPPPVSIASSDFEASSREIVEKENNEIFSEKLQKLRRIIETELGDDEELSPDLVSNLIANLEKELMAKKMAKKIVENSNEAAVALPVFASLSQIDQNENNNKQTIEVLPTAVDQVEQSEDETNGIVAPALIDSVAFLNDTFNDAPLSVTNHCQPDDNNETESSPRRSRRISIRQQIREDSPAPPQPISASSSPKPASSKRGRKPNNIQAASSAKQGNDEIDLDSALEVLESPVIGKKSTKAAPRTASKRKLETPPVTKNTPKLVKRESLTPGKSISFKPWSEEELDAIKQGVEMFGKDAWEQIQEAHPVLANRTYRMMEAAWSKNISPMLSASKSASKVKTSPASTPSGSKKSGKTVAPEMKTPKPEFASPSTFSARRSDRNESIGDESFAQSEEDSDEDIKSNKPSSVIRLHNFTREQFLALKEGVERFGEGRWADIKAAYPEHFADNHRNQLGNHWRRLIANPAMMKYVVEGSDDIVIRKHVAWTPADCQAVKAGYMHFGFGNWAGIIDMYPRLKDRSRIECKSVWHKMKRDPEYATKMLGRPIDEAEISASKADIKTGFTPEQIQAVKDGLKRFGSRNWSAIIKNDKRLAGYSYNSVRKVGIKLLENQSADVSGEEDVLDTSTL